MALTGTDRGSGNHNTGALSFGFAPGSNLTAGALAVLCLAADNANATGPGASSVITVTDTKLNVWTRRCTGIIDPGNASAGQEGAIFTTDQAVGTLTTGDTITVTFAQSTTAKTWTLMEVTGSVGVPTFKSQNVGTGGTGTTSPTITTSASVTVGQMVIAALALEAGTTETITQDGDTTNGNWSAQQTNEIGSTTGGSNIASQRKVQTTTASTQTYNPTLGILGDLCLMYIIVGEDSISTPSLGEPTLTGLSPTFATTANLVVTPPVGVLSVTGFAPTVFVSVSATPGLGAVAATGLAPRALVSVTAFTGAGAAAVTGFAPTVRLNQQVTPGVGAIQVQGLAPSVIVAPPGTSVDVTPSVGEIVVQGLAPSVVVTAAVTAPRKRGAANYGWKATLDSWREQREEEEEEERERIRKELEKLVGPVRAREILQRRMALAAERERAETEEVCLVAALTGDTDE